MDENESSGEKEAHSRVAMWFLAIKMHHENRKRHKSSTSSTDTLEKDSKDDYDRRIAVATAYEEV